MKVVTTEQMRDLEREAAAMGMPERALMENAGRAVAEAGLEMVADVPRPRVLALVGPGNNGGDGLVAARHLAGAGAQVVVYLWNRPGDDLNLTLALERGARVVRDNEDTGWQRLRDLVSWSDLVVDALLGTGRARPVEGSLRELLLTVIEARPAALPVLAVDLPSGLGADDGSLDPSALRADVTVALGCPKLGLYLPPGSGAVGRVVVGDLGLAAALSERVAIELITSEWVARLLPERPPLGHKGTFGRLLVVAGSAHYRGAAALTCSAALRSGAGLVNLAGPEVVCAAVAARLPECTFTPLPAGEDGLKVVSPEALRQAVAECDALAFGPGLGQSQRTAGLVRGLCRAVADAEPPKGVVVDADGLNNLAGVAEWWLALPERCVLTPHPAELGRLLGSSASEVQSDRLGVALGAAARWKKVVALKGANTIVAAPDGRSAISPGVTPALAAGGTGDVLTGIVAGLLAQGLAPYEAAVAGVYLHWRAALDASEGRNSGLLASDIVASLPRTMARLRRGEVEN